MRKRTAAALAAVALTAACSGGGTAGLTARAVTRGLNLRGAVPWIGAAPPPFMPPITRPAARATNARPCTSADLTAWVTGSNGATGHVETLLAFRNTSPSTCVLKGFPRVVTSEPGRPAVTGTDGSFFPWPGSANRRPGQVAYLGVETDTYCAARPSGGPAGRPYHHLEITLRGGGTVALDSPRLALGVTCGLHLSHFFIPEAEPPPPPPDPLSRLQGSLQAPDTVAAGSSLTYLADLTNPTGRPIGLRRCPGYIQWTPGPRQIKDEYALNCRSDRTIPAHSTVRFVMRLTVPAREAPGSLTFSWALMVADFTPAKATVRVLPDAGRTES